MASSYQTPRSRSSSQLGSRRAAPPSNANKAHPPLPSAAPLSHNSGLSSSRLSLLPAYPPPPPAAAAGAKFSTPSRGLKVRISSASSISSDSPRAPLSARSDASCTRSDMSCARSALDVKRAENVVVTVRFRPLSGREIQQGDEVAWYADGDVTVRSEFNPSTAYAYDRVFGPATTTRNVYDVAAQHVITGAMEGINGTVFAYGVTSSGKTHTMHGVQKSPGIIPIAVKDVFNIIQDMPGREFLLRVSYLEIYNEVINDLLNPMGQNLRIREDSQGTYVEGVKQEVVLSPAHALSMIAAGEEHRHVGSNNFNLISSRSHTIFTLTIESSPQGNSYNNKEVTLSQLNLIDLAGSESSKAETTGLRRKEGSYINKSLLTLGTVISKLTDAKASHIPYRDSKLTRLLQSSLSGNGRVSLICTLTPASSCNEETHNTLKFAQRAKHVEVHVSPNIIMDEKSLIKKYQKEIMKLKEELQQLKKGMIQRPSFSTTQEDLRTLRQQMEAGQVQLQSRLEEEEQAKEALMVRIQRLTKLILVSTKETIPYSTVERPSHRRRYSFGEEELAYLPEQKRGYNEDIATGPTEAKAELFTHEDGSKEERKTKKHGMLSWLKLRRPEKLQISSLNSVDHESSSNGSPADRSNNSIESNSEHKATKHKLKKSSDDFMPITEPYLETTQAGELFSASNRGRRLPPTGTTIVDQMDLLKEQIKMLSGEVALCTSALKRMTEQASNKPDDIELKAQIKKVKEEIRDKEHQIQILEQKIMDTKEIMTPRHSSIELSQMMSKLKNQLSERSFEVELKSADNRILQEQLQSKTVEIKNLQQTVSSLQSQLRAAVESKYFGNKKTNSFADSHRKANNTHELQEEFSDWLNTTDLSRELHFVEGGVMSKGFDSQVFSTRKREPYGNPQFLAQAATIEKLKQEKIRLEEEREGLKINTQKLSDEASYAKELASAAAVELKNLAEEVKKLSSQNSKLRSDLAAAQNLALWQTSSISLKDVSSKSNNHEHSVADSILTNQSDISLLEKNSFANGQVMSDASKIEMETRIQDLCQELRTRKESEVVLESLLTEKDHLLADLQKHVAESKHREMELESDLAGMWVLVAKLKSETGLEQTTVKPQEPLDRNTESRLGKGSAFDKYDNGSLRASQKNDSQLDGMEEMDVLLDDMKHAPYDRSDMMQHLHVAVAQSTGR